MQQLEFKWFWPLEEQIALDLDYPTNLYGYGTQPNLNLMMTDGKFTHSNISGGVLTINTDEVVFRTKQPQSLFQRWFFGLLGLRVEKV